MTDPITRRAKPKRPRKVSDVDLTALNWQLELTGATFRFRRVSSRLLMTVPFIRTWEH